MAESKPKKGEFVDPERIRQVFYTIGGDLLDELSAYRGIRLRQKEKEEHRKLSELNHDNRTGKVVPKQFISGFSQSPIKLIFARAYCSSIIFILSQ